MSGARAAHCPPAAVVDPVTASCDQPSSAWTSPQKSSSWIVVALLLVAMLTAAGCAAVIDGAARPAPGIKPRPVVGETIKQVLLGQAALSRLLDQPFSADPRLPPRYGGPEKLLHGFGSVSPAECAGVPTMIGRSVYPSANVKNVARETWWNAGGPAKVISVAEATVAMRDTADADELFARFSRQWDACDGETVTITGSGLRLVDDIADVRVAYSVLAATVFVQSSGPVRGRRPEARAIGVRVNCLVEVEVAFFSAQGSSDRGSGDPRTSAIGIARAMMDKISALS